MRGEHVNVYLGAIDAGGSSPHARGALGVPESKMRTSGIIPACAGSTVYDGKTSSHAKDHPRMRGEHHQACVPLRPCLGSSPHARGAQ